ncbi:MAG: hypothetical protein JWN01_1021 [Patescibacteria group bacterium]|nr:hypothetical protein [Patescibacteria group bacterium]
MKRLYLIRGPICAGKSSLVEELRRRVAGVSIVDIDSFKRQIDSEGSSDWRRELALEIGLFFARRLMEHNRTIVADIHSSSHEQHDGFVQAALATHYEVIQVLLEPPLEVCLERNCLRDIPDVSYTLSDEVVQKYWCNTYRAEGELVFDSSSMSTREIADSILAGRSSES